MLHPNKQPDGMMLTAALGMVTLVPILVQVYRMNFEVKRWENSDFSPYGQQ
ncbi:MAG: hypothetical protein U0892_05690 [Pirellulales bacterium]